MTSRPTMMGMRAVLLDIEGTVTPIRFVHDVLFPYARTRLRTYLTQYFDSDEVRPDLDKLREEYVIDLSEGRQPPLLPVIDEQGSIDSIVPYLEWLMDQDRKSPGLKSLQGRIWEQGYRDGSLKAPIFPDVVPALKRWHREATDISIFSSGSVLAQKLLFQFTEAGDLTRYIRDYFDTSTGSKSDQESYLRIASNLSHSPNAVLFVSDVVAELEAASKAGMKTLLCIRPGNGLQSSINRFQSIESFQEIDY
jgi:enolase-phosphatase E1